MMETKKIELYRVYSAKSGAIIWDGKAYSPSDALEQMARDAGYRDFETACDDSGDNGSHLVVEALISYKACRP